MVACFGEGDHDEQDIRVGPHAGGGCEAWQGPSQAALAGGFGSGGTAQARLFGAADPTLAPAGAIRTIPSIPGGRSPRVPHRFYFGSSPLPLRQERGRTDLGSEGAGAVEAFDHRRYRLHRDAGSRLPRWELSGAKYLNSAAFPQATFVATTFHPTDATHGKVDGTFTLMGKTKPVTFDVMLVGAGPGFGHARMGIHAETAINPHWRRGFLPRCPAARSHSSSTRNSSKE